MEGPLTLTAETNTERIFTCKVSSTRGPKKSDMSWWLDDNPLNIIEGPANEDVDKGTYDTEVSVVKVTAFVTPEWNGKRVKCLVKQEDDLVKGRPSSQ